MEGFGSDGEKSDDSFAHRDEKYWSKTQDDFDARKLFNDEASADITIKYADKEIRARRWILIMRSEYFKRILAPKTAFKVRIAQRISAPELLLTSSRSGMVSSN